MRRRAGTPAASDEREAGDESRASRAALRVMHPRPVRVSTRNLLGVGPQPLELIEVAERRVEDVHDEIDEVEQHPSALLESFDVMRRRAFLLQLRR